MAVRNARAVKTAFEIDCIRQAALQLDKMFLDIPSQLHEGLPEFELAARIEYVLRMAGHQGLTRVRRFNMEMHYGAVSFGETSAYPHAFDGPVGVRGLYPAVPAMGSKKTLKRGEPIMIDICGGYAGYIADGSRTYSIGAVSPQMKDTHQFILELNAWIEQQLRPGNIPSEIYSSVMNKVVVKQNGFYGHLCLLFHWIAPFSAPENITNCSFGSRFERRKESSADTRSSLRRRSIAG